MFALILDIIIDRFSDYLSLVYSLYCKEPDNVKKNVVQVLVELCSHAVINRLRCLALFVYVVL